MKRSLAALFALALITACGDDESTSKSESSYDCDVFAQTLIDCVESETQDEFDEKVQVCEDMKAAQPQAVSCYEAAGTECAAFLACGD